VDEALGALDPDYDLASYDYDLPPELIAQEPAEPRDAARLLVLDRASGSVSHAHIRDLPDLLASGDLLVANHSRVLPCRLLGTKDTGGGQVEILLLHSLHDETWQALVRGHRVHDGQRVTVAGGVGVEIGPGVDGSRSVSFPPGTSVPDLLHTHGQMPLPPYIRAYQGDPARYQTVYAAVDGSAAAPTAGLHFTPELLTRLQSCGVGWATVLLHVGLDTFRHVTEADVRRHHIHTEWVEVAADAVQQVQATAEAGKRTVAVGTTSVRALEQAAASGRLAPFYGSADLYIVPGYRFRAVDALLTNFHLPRTSLLLLVSALAGRERILAAYEEAIRLRYRFFSFGDAMLII
jgi:S-adenosylmethionine:tRNA ribosyltransferase-isomerase